MPRLRAGWPTGRFAPRSTRSASCPAYGQRRSTLPLRLGFWSDLILSHGEVSASTFIRSPERLRADGVDACNLTLLTQGAWSATFAGRPTVVGAGQFAALDCTQPSAAEVDADNRYINLSVARAALLSTMPRLPDFHGRVLDTPAGYLLADHLISLTRYLPRLGAEQIPLVRQATLLLIAAAFKDLPRLWPEQERAGLRHAALRYIERHLSERDLTPERIRHDLEISRTALYEVFAPVGGVRAHVQRRRLEVVRALLMLPSEGRTIAELAESFGFVSPSHFAQAFPRRLRPERERGARRSGSRGDRCRHRVGRTSADPTALRALDERAGRAVVRIRETRVFCAARTHTTVHGRTR